MNLRALRYEFCSRCNAVELHRDLQCMSCEREGVLVPEWQPKPETNPTELARLRKAKQRMKYAQKAGLASGSARRLHAHQKGVAITVKGQSAQQRNRDRIEKALADPRVIAATTGERHE